MDWTALADGFVVVMQALSGAMLVAGAAMWIREGLRGEGADFDLTAGRRDRSRLRRASTARIFLISQAMPRRTHHPLNTLEPAGECEGNACRFVPPRSGGCRTLARRIRCGR